MNELISGKEALIALANGEKVELQIAGDVHWYDSTQWTVRELLCFKGKFRIKPKTITINGIKVPAPFKPPENLDNSKTWYTFSGDDECGYSECKNPQHPSNMFGAWETEEEIKQVVEALRSIFK